jgi:hypothetical protein
VHDRFGNVREQYEGLYWSHFQAALEFEDAEMWLEGAVQNGWSVSKMRHARWEALGAPENLKPRDEDVISVELDEDGLAPAGDAVPLAAELAEVLDPDAQADATDAPSDDESDRGGSARDEGGDEKGSVSDDAKPDVPRLRPFKDLPELPDDLTDAVESMQLAILHHKQDEWREVAVDDLLLTLDALKKLAVSPA